jgi:DNA (cytosine-5)-methyltransferase 1
MKEKASSEPMNSKVAFENLPKIYPSKLNPKHSHSVKLNGVALPNNHEPRMHSERDIEIFKMLTEDILSGTEKYTSSKALIQLYKEKNW